MSDNISKSQIIVCQFPSLKTEFYLSSSLFAVELPKNDVKPAARSGSLYCAVKSFSTKKVDEVSVSIGSVVEVLRKSEDGWWLVRYLSHP